MKALPLLAIQLLAITIILQAPSVVASGPGHKHGAELIKEIKKKFPNTDHAVIISKRRDIMHALGDSMKRIAKGLKQEVSITDLNEAAIKIEEIGRIIPSLFPPGTGMETYNGVTGAKSAIFSDASGFKTLSLKMSSLASDFIEAANTGASTTVLRSKFRLIGRQTCGGCHRIYREKLRH
ncbi:MAG: hypothetical protein CFH41_01064 [Alphaproteobacteria bacterium MarineAlpha11_Bin1]|nr:MAG: hypothetical protein CFH41_01064 [Alphaproteobacteria bacterium MarineAlpha11_Bin1]|tara:strand:- start:3695 stop:4234 length:540 start_codon:yes stop_codon:yes gene_type:complete